MNLGKWMHTYFRHDGAFIVSPDRQVVHGFMVGEPQGADAFKLVESTILPLVNKLQARLIAGDTTGFSGQVLSIGESDLVDIGGRPTVVSVKPIVSDTGDIKQTPGREFLHVAIRYLDGDFLATMASEYLFADMRFDRSIAPGDARAYAPLTSASGQTLGFFFLDSVPTWSQCCEHNKTGSRSRRPDSGHND